MNGECYGTDKFSKTWAVENCVQTAGFEVTSRQWSKLGKRVGPRRNQIMLVVTRPSLLVAFPGGTGTNGCVEIAKSLGINIRDERGNG